LSPPRAGGPRFCERLVFCALAGSTEGLGLAPEASGAPGEERRRW
jgi:hypothetical protein